MVGDGDVRSALKPLIRALARSTRAGGFVGEVAQPAAVSTGLDIGLDGVLILIPSLHPQGLQALTR